MNPPIDLQFDYFSDNFHQFEMDYYRYSLLDIPLTFLTDDFLHFLSERQTNYFCLNAVHAKDKKNHFFYFQVKKRKNSYCYVYVGHRYEKEK